MDINVDFDGTCVKHDFPDIGKDIGAIPVLKRLVNHGNRLILFTMRDGESLENAIKWFADNDIPLYGVQTNPVQYRWTKSPKSFAHIMIDDSALGCPVIYDKEPPYRKYVDWVKVEELLELEGCFK